MHWERIKAGLEIALDCGNPKKFKHVLKFATADYDSLVLITRPGHCEDTPDHWKALRYLELEVLAVLLVFNLPIGITETK